MRPSTSLQGSQWFSSLDLKLGYWHVKMDEESKPLTTFTVGPFGIYECKRMPFGLTNTPATFWRLMKTCLRDLNLHWCIIYLDDTVIFFKDLASHLEKLEAVFQKLEEAGFQLKLSKCELFWQQVAYLGLIMSTQGIATDKSKIEAIRNWPVLTNITEVWSFLEFMGYYCQFIPKFNAGSPTPAWVNLGWECQQEIGCLQAEWQVQTGLWWPEKTVHHHI